MSGTPITADIKQRILELHAQGKTRNHIAKTTGVSHGSVTNVVHAAGLTFERTAGSIAGTAARQNDLRARRVKLLEDLQTHSEELLARARGNRHTVIFKGEYGAEEEREVSVLPTREMRDITWAIGSNVATMVRLAAVDAGTEADAAKSMLSGVQQQLQAYAGVADQDVKAPEPKEPEGAK